MKQLAFLIAALVFALPHTAQADEATGKIVSIDEGTQSLKLDDGNVYKLPGEFEIGRASCRERVLMPV